MEKPIKDTYVEVILAKIDPELWDTPTDPDMFPLRIPTEKEYAQMAIWHESIELEKNPKTRRAMVWNAANYMKKASSQSLYIREESWAMFKTFDEARCYINGDTTLDDGGYFNFAMLTEKKYGINCIGAWPGPSKREFYRINPIGNGCFVEKIDCPKRIERYIK